MKQSLTSSKISPIENYKKHIESLFKTTKLFFNLLKRCTSKRRISTSWTKFKKINMNQD